jgi:hypothetical protein
MREEKQTKKIAKYYVKIAIEQNQENNKMFKLQSENFIFFKPEDLINLCKIHVSDTTAKNLLEEINNSVNKRDTLNKLNINKKNLEKVLLKKEYIEFLTSIIISKFYTDIKIGFQVKNRIKIEELNLCLDKFKELRILIEAVEENTDCDFALQNLNGTKKFQLKQCRKKLNTNNLFNYIKKIIDSYKNLGNTNLIILAQGNLSIDQVNEEVDINEIYRKIITLNLNFNGEILIIRNDQNYNFYIYEVYPKKRKYQKKINIKKIMSINTEITKNSLQKVGL